MNNDELMHYGVLGMKWGHRKQRPQSGYIARGNAAQTKYRAAKTKYKNAKKSGKNLEAAKSNYQNIKKATSYDRKRRYTYLDRTIDKVTYGKIGQARIEKHIDNGNSRTVAYGREIARKTLASSLGTIAVVDLMSGGAISKQAVTSVGKKVADSFIKRNARKSITKIAMNPYFNPIDVAYKVIT